MSEEYRVRRLTPKECFLLMGLTAEDLEKAQALGLSESALYKQAGNGIVTNCVELLGEHLYKSQYDETYQCTDEKYAKEE
jgi:DNA (cytosine-5)-methyltransferase 1